MSATYEVKSSAFKIKVPSAQRNQPELEFEHRKKTGNHLSYLKNENLFNINDPRWGKKTENGQAIYFHRYEGTLLTVTLEHPKFKLSHSDNTLFDQHLQDNPSENTVFVLTSKCDGIESTHTMTASTMGFTSVGLVVAGLSFTYGVALGVEAAEAAALAGTEITMVLGMEVNVVAPGVGVVLAILALIGVWIAWAVERNIFINVIYENRSSKTIKLVEHYAYNIKDDGKVDKVVLTPFVPDPDGFDSYDDVVFDVANDWKNYGIGLSLKFQKEDGSHLIICFRNDIHYSANYCIAVSNDSPYNVYYNCVSGTVSKEDFKWDNVVVKNCIDTEDFKNYKIHGIISFHDS